MFACFIEYIAFGRCLLKMKKLYLYFTFLCLLILSGCSSAGSISTFTLGVDAMPKNLDPQIATQQVELLVLTNIYDGLFELSAQGIPVPNLVKDYTVSDDGKTYTFTLKTDSVYTYSDSKKQEKAFNQTPVTAQDFVFALQRVINPSTHSPYYNEFSNIKNASLVHNGNAPISSLGVKAIGQDTLQIQLENADFNFIDKLCLPAAFPCNEEFFNSTKGAYGLSIKNILSNGPFKLNYLDTENGNATILRVQESKNTIDRIRLKKIDGQDLQTSYEEELISGFFENGVAQSNYPGSASQSFSSSVISLVYNLEKPQFSNSQVRQALAYYAYAFQNSGANLQAVPVSSSIFPDTITLNQNRLNAQISVQPPIYLSQSPKDLIQQGCAALGQDKLSGITLLIPNDSKYTIIFENINQLWQKELNQFFNVELLPTAEIVQRVAKGNFDIAFTLITPTQNSPYTLFNSIEKYDFQLTQYLNAAKSKPHPQDAVSEIAKAQNYALDQALLAPLGTEYSTFWHRKYFSNILVSPFGNIINLKYATVN